MLTTEENEFLTQVGRGTPCGELLRRYWHPVTAAAELTEEKPIRAVKILDEELVVYRDKKGNYGLVGEHCPHRSASLAYGRVDEEGIRCPYHGWKFDCTGKCLEQPAEPADSTFKDRIKHVAYPVQYLGGLIYAYMGPAPAPLLPRWDVLVWEHGKRWIVKESIIDCNWLQPMENSVDPSHLYWLHGDTAHLAPKNTSSSASNTASKNAARLCRWRPAPELKSIYIPCSFRRFCAMWRRGTRPAATGTTFRSACLWTTFILKFFAPTSSHPTPIALRPTRPCRVALSRLRPDRASTR